MKFDEKEKRMKTKKKMYLLIPQWRDLRNYSRKNCTMQGDQDLCELNKYEIAMKYSAVNSKK